MTRLYFKFVSMAMAFRIHGGLLLPLESVEQLRRLRDKAPASSGIWHCGMYILYLHCNYFCVAFVEAYEDCYPMHHSQGNLSRPIASAIAAAEQLPRRPVNTQSSIGGFQFGGTLRHGDGQGVRTGLRDQSRSPLQLLFCLQVLVGRGFCRVWFLHPLFGVHLPSEQDRIKLQGLLLPVLAQSGNNGADDIGMLGGRYGEEKTWWMAVCDQVSKFCNRALTSIILWYLAFFCYFALSIISAQKLSLLSKTNL
ncbi:hypothetical protein SAY87_025695 [Trapa incisa]|uniref:CASP-like protein n=1 Tax=Trapa incisa TaxID=236973 RepID=A0AAN7GTT0_9MYRT|nr:hypothetical protein SAY87_025695 [Trapa incisa]